MHDSAMTTATLAYRRFEALAATADQTLPTRLAGWQVGDLIDHVTWGASMEAAAVFAAAGRPAAAEPDASAGALADAIASFAEAATLHLDPDATVTLAAGPVPMAFAAPLFAFEAAVHSDDLADALGQGRPDLSADELAACGVVLGPMLDLVAGPTPEVGVRIDLIGLGEAIRLTATDAGWERGTPTNEPATTTVTGSAQQIALFASGRIAADAVQITGEPVHAERFKTYFPGP